VTLRIGRIEYANCTPLFTALTSGCDCADYNFITGVPARLNTLLANGDIDLCPSSSIEYGKAFEKYCLLPDLSISSIGPVKSVLLFSSIPLEQLGNRSIGLTTESATSVALLKIILSRQFGFTNDFSCTSLPFPAALDSFAGLLLIGDAALRAAAQGNGYYVYDLGELWYAFTGLPFVFALWIVRRDVAIAKSSEILALSEKLLAAKRSAYDSYEKIAHESVESQWLDPAELVAYWRTISYDLTPAHLAGVRCFFRYAAELGILAGEPKITMFHELVSGRE
jgi:chorismate dehydratase